MGIQSALIIAEEREAEAIRGSDNPAATWNGFGFNGMDNVKIATLLSFLSGQSPDVDLERWLEALPMTGGGPEGPWLFRVESHAVALLADVASQDDGGFDALATSWGATEEFEDWQADDVRELLRAIGDLAEMAGLEDKRMFLWVSL